MSKYRIFSKMIALFLVVQIISFLLIILSNNLFFLCILSVLLLLSLITLIYALIHKSDVNTKIFYNILSANLAADLLLFAFTFWMKIIADNRLLITILVVYVILLLLSLRCRQTAVKKNIDDTKVINILLAVTLVILILYFIFNILTRNINKITISIFIGTAGTVISLIFNHFALYNLRRIVVDKRHQIS